jgi:hypothetical protein
MKRRPLVRIPSTSCMDMSKKKKRIREGEAIVFLNGLLRKCLDLDRLLILVPT